MDNITSVLADFWEGLRIAFTEPPAAFVTWGVIAGIIGLVVFLIWWNHR